MDEMAARRGDGHGGVSEGSWAGSKGRVGKAEEDGEVRARVRGTGSDGDGEKRRVSLRNVRFVLWVLRGRMWSEGFRKK